MSCLGCGNKGKNYTMYDRHGNVVNNRQYDPSVDDVLSPNGQSAKDKSFDEIMKEKEALRSEVRRRQEKMLKDYSEDMKLIMIKELIDIYNHKEISMVGMSPSQALVALWNHLHNPAFEKIAKRFSDLVREVDEIYSEIQLKQIRNVVEY